MQTYTVQRGDTLYGISKQFGVPIETIKKTNNLTSDNLMIGQVLRIPTTITTMNYTVKKGDSLYTIAQKYNSTIQELKEVNNLTSNNLAIGQVLKIPINNSGEAGAGNITYIVKKDDSLYKIANKYGVTITALKKANNLTSDSLDIGQVLIIPINQSPIPPTNYIEYTVKKGDSLYLIAQRYDVTVDDIIEFNNLKSTILSVGQILRIPTKSTVPPTPGGIKECYGTNYQKPEYITHTVKKGDNLYDLARKYNTSVIHIMDLNDLKSTNLQIGQVLKIRER